MVEGHTEFNPFPFCAKALRHGYEKSPHLRICLNLLRKTFVYDDSGEIYSKILPSPLSTNENPRFSFKFGLLFHFFVHFSPFVMTKCEFFPLKKEQLFWLFSCDKRVVAYAVIKPLSMRLKWTHQKR